MNMKPCRFQHMLCFLCLLSFLYCLFPIDGFAGQRITVRPGDHLTNIPLNGPFCQEDRQYLGLSDQKVYSLRSIKTGFVIINCLSIYCPVCQNHAAKFNKLFALIQRDQFISNTMKMIGIGAGNNSKEIAYFRKYHNVLFPLIPDPDFKIHKTLKETRTPLLAIIDKRSNPYKIVSILDFTKEPEALLEDIRSEIHKIK